MKITWQCEKCSEMNETETENIGEMQYYSGELQCENCGLMQIVEGLADAPVPKLKCTICGRHIENSLVVLEEHLQDHNIDVYGEAEKDNVDADIVILEYFDCLD